MYDQLASLERQIQDEKDKIKKCVSANRHCFQALNELLENEGRREILEEKKVEVPEPGPLLG